MSETQGVQQASQPQDVQASQSPAVQATASESHAQPQPMTYCRIRWLCNTPCGNHHDDCILDDNGDCTDISQAPKCQLCGERMLDYDCVWVSALVGEQMRLQLSRIPYSNGVILPEKVDFLGQPDSPWMWQ